MKKYFLSIIIIALTILVSSCKTNPDATSADGAATSTLTGKVVNELSGDGIENAIIRVSDGTTEKGATTDENGNYTVEIDLLTDSELKIYTYADGYFNDTSSVFAIKGETTNVPLIKLRQNSNSGSSQSGKASSIYLYSQSVTFVGVKESGSNETAQLIFEVLDSSGVPINDKNSITVNFSFGSSPGGGEYLYPSSAKTNSLGKVTCTFNSGTIAGVSEVIATISRDGKTIKSRPVLIAIHGGFPDINHFHVASEKLNYPFLGGVGFEINFTAYAGDKYSNPVRPGTSVYFETTSGIIQGSNQTDNLGRATVTLLTQPSPNHPTYGKGFFVVTAKTVDENQTLITTNTLRLLSGFPLITISPTTFNVKLGGLVSFDYTVMDVNNNPIAEGNKISVTTNGADVELAGMTSVDMPDVLYGMTHFSFSLINVADSANTRPITITITTSGKNGNNSLSISGTAE